MERSPQEFLEKKVRVDGIVVGASIPVAVGRSIYPNMNAQVQTQAMALGDEVTYLEPQDALKIMDAGENRGYERAWDLRKVNATGK